MRNGQLIDLDELVLRCRNDQAREYIAEAVACYKVGAFRACIVATWTAFVFDYLHKLQELELTGDKNAQKQLEDFEKLRKKGDVVGSLNFERKILDIAKDTFELLSPIEYEDLKRLQNDRNRCAHPSMIAQGEVYNPPAELARYHLRNVVTSFLQYPPVQGKSAFELLKQTINSAYFPQDVASAKKRLASGPLGRPRDTLVNRFVVFIIQAFLYENLDAEAKKRYLAALNATREMHRSQVEKLLHTKFAGICAKVSDDNLLNLLELLAGFYDSYQFLGDSAGRLEVYLKKISGDELVIAIYYALRIPELRPLTDERVKKFKYRDFRKLIKLGAIHPTRVLIRRAIILYCRAKSFSASNSLSTDVIIPISKHFTEDDVIKIVNCMAENDQLSDSFERDHVLNTIAETLSENDLNEFNSQLIKLGLKEEIDEKEE